jgi:superfamily II DNA helicase RecQ
VCHLQDIISQLRMGQHSRQPGGRGYRQWVMSFERPRLHLAVQMRAAGGASANMAQLVSEAAAGAQPSTLVYAQTTNEVDSLTAYLQAKGVKTVK